MLNYYLASWCAMHILNISYGLMFVETAFLLMSSFLMNQAFLLTIHNDI